MPFHLSMNPVRVTMSAVRSNRTVVAAQPLPLMTESSNFEQVTEPRSITRG